MTQINKVTIFLKVLDINETVKFYTTIFNFIEEPIDNELTILKNTNCILVISEVEKPEIITFGFDIEDATSIINKIKNDPSIRYTSPIDNAKPEFAIQDNSGNEIVLNNCNYHKY